MEFKIFPGSLIMMDCQNKPSANLSNPYPNFKKKIQCDPLMIKVEGVTKIVSLMFPKKIYRSGKVCDLPDPNPPSPPPS